MFRLAPGCTFNGKTLPERDAKLLESGLNDLLGGPAPSDWQSVHHDGTIIEGTPAFVSMMTRRGPGGGAVPDEGEGDERAGVCGASSKAPDEGAEAAPFSCTSKADAAKEGRS